MKQKENDYIVDGVKESFANAKNEIGIITSGLMAIYNLTDEFLTQDLAEQSLKEAKQAETHLKKAEEIINGKISIKPTKQDLFAKIQESLRTVQELIMDEVSEEDSTKSSDLDQANHLIQDAIDILERAELRAEGHFKGCKTTRVILQTMGEYFTADHTTPQLRFTGIPDDYKQ